MKLIVQIPCLNEEKQIAETIKSIPTRISGIDQIEVLVIDDGSTDQTVNEARKSGAHHIISIPQRKGLAAAFMVGLEECLNQRADIIVNFDGDNQYNAADIPKLIEPILRNTAQIVIGDRQFHQVEHFGLLKQRLQRFGSFVVSSLTGLKINDAVSGFRAFSQEAALKINLHSQFSHTLETIIFAAKEQIILTSIPIRTNAIRRPSRLAPSMWSFIKKSVASIIRAYLIYDPFKALLCVGTILFIIGTAPLVRFIFFFVYGKGNGHIQSLIFGSIFMILGFIAIAIGLLADLLALNRRLIERQLLEAKKTRLHL